MKIEKDIYKFLVFKEETILNTLNKISNNEKGFILIVDENGFIEGIVTDGDFRRWILNNKNIDLKSSVQDVMNSKFEYAYISDPIESIHSRFSSKVKFLPLLDKSKRVKAIALSGESVFHIGNRKIGETEQSFIIAEIGINHNGDKVRAKDMIDAAVESGADCVKFQMRNLEKLYGEVDEKNFDIGSQYLLNLLKRFELKPEEMFELFDYAKSKNVIPLCTPWDSVSLNHLENYGIKGYKVASADFTNHIFLKEIIKTNKPTILSCGMCSESEITDTINLLNSLGAMYALLHCNSTYPPPYKDVNLNYMVRLKEKNNVPIGYSGHERGYHIPVAAVALGAKIIEKHFTLDKELEGNDHKVSLLPFEFKNMVENIRDLEIALGEKSKRYVSQGEIMNRNTLSKSIYLKKNVNEGEVFHEDCFEIKSPGKGIQPNRIKEIIGKKAKKNYKIDDLIYESDISESLILKRNFLFKRPWGIPVRYHDYKSLLEYSNPDFLEFHLSFKDLELSIEEFIPKKLPYDLVVHAPDLFSGDHLLHIAHNDKNHRERSIYELKRTIEITKRLREKFEVKNKTFLVTSIGAFTTDRFLTEKEKKNQYEITAEELDKLYDSEIEILPQTLPPFPWYFGGQLYLNLFVDAEDTYQFCKEYGLRICLDISHSKLAANFKKYSFEKFIELLAPFTAHIHIVDAAGVDSEGLQIDEGEIDFKYLSEQLSRLCPNASFIPEIWQGHKNSGEGFWIALNRLEKYF